MKGSLTLSHRMTGGTMLVTVHISQGSSGLFFAKSPDARDFLASHPNEAALRSAIPFMVKQWAEDNGYSSVTVRVLPPGDSAREADSSHDVRIKVDFCEPALAV